MTVVTTRPDATVAVGDTAIFGGAASSHAATNNEPVNDATGVQLAATNDSEADALKLGMAEPAIPAGARTMRMDVRIRCDVGFVPSNTMKVRLKPSDAFAQHVVSWSDPQTINSVGTVWTSTPVGCEVHIWQQAFAIYEVYLDTTYCAKPVCNPTLPTGTYNSDNRPPVAWANTLDSAGGGQVAYQIKVFDSANYPATPANATNATNYDWTSGIVSSGASSTEIGTALLDGTYRAYVRTAQWVNGSYHWSDWDFEGFVVDVLAPGVPTLTATQDADGRIKLVATSTAGESGTTTDKVEFQRSLDFGETWEEVRTTEVGGRATPSSGVSTVWDYEAPNGRDVMYRARAVHDYGTNGEAFSNWTFISEINLLTNDDFESNTTGWIGNGGAVLSSTDEVGGVSGTKSMKVVVPATANAGPFTNPGMAAVVGDLHATSVWLRGKDGGERVDIRLNYYNAALAQLTVNQITVTLTREWQQFDYSTPAAPATTAWVYLLLYQPNAIAQTFYVDKARLWKGTALEGKWRNPHWWIKHPGQPELNHQLRNPVYSEPGNERQGRVGVFSIPGRSTAVGVTDTPGPRTGVIAFDLDTQEEIDAINAIVDTGDIVLIQAPPEHHWPDRYVVLNSQVENRHVDKVGVEDRIVPLSWTEVEAPAGIVESWPL